jgi:hypothetical protein
VVPEQPPSVRWQALLVGVASNVHSDDPGFVQSLNSQAEFALAIERNMPGLAEDDLIVLPEPRYGREVTDAIAALNDVHDQAAKDGLTRSGLLFYYCGHGMDAGDRLYLSMVETIDNDAQRRRTGLALGDVINAIRATTFKRPQMALILDCCFAGLACEESEARRADLLMAVGPDVPAMHDPSSTGPTYFTSALVELLREGDPAAGPWIDMETAGQWLEPRLVARHGQERRPRWKQPDAGGKPVALGRNPAYAGPPPPATNRPSTPVVTCE